MHTSSNNAGFSMLELLVALAVFSLIGIGSHAMLRSVLAAQEAQHIHSEALARLQKAVWLMEQDVSQAEPGSVKATGGMLLSLRRIGWRNPLGLPRSDIEFVSYGLKGDKLVRYYGTSPDAVQAQTFLDHVSDVRMGLSASGLVEIAFKTQEFGNIRRVVEVPQ
jgi:general secretion pathway protein J